MNTACPGRNSICWERGDSLTSLQQKVIRHHTTAEQAGTLFSKVKPKLAVYSHIVPAEAPTLAAQTKKTYDGPLEVGADLMTIDVGDRVIVHRPE